MQDNLFIPILAGTTRKQRRSIHAARLIESVGKKIKGIETKFVDPREFNFPYDGNDEIAKDPAYTKLVERADGFFFVFPEYNHSFPGSLKRMIDSELKLYIHKPVAFAGVSSGPWGGVRGIEAIVPVVRELGLVATFTDVQFPHVKKLFDEDGNLQDDNYIKRIKRSYNELIWMAKTLKWGREKLPQEQN